MRSGIRVSRTHGRSMRFIDKTRLLYQHLEAMKNGIRAYWKGLYWVSVGVQGI
jgi:hypothetical protein